MRKILILSLLIYLGFVNNVFAENIGVFLYKNNLIKLFYNWEKTLNWKLFTWTIVVDEEGKIIHTLTQSWTSIRLDNVVLDIQNSNRVLFLENGWYIINEFNPPEWKNNYITYNWDILFKWSNNDYNIEKYKYIVTTRIIKNNENIGSALYFIDKNKQFFPIVSSWNWLYFIDKEKKNLVYDITCKDNYLHFFYNWWEIINTQWVQKIFFPTYNDYTGINTLLNINWKQYFLTDDDVSFTSCNIFLESDNKSQTIEVKNSEIIANIQKQDTAWNEEREEYIKGGLLNEMADWLYIGANKVYYKWKVYILKNPTNNSEDFMLSFMFNSELRELLLNLENNKTPPVESPMTLNEFKNLIQNSKEVIVDNSGDKTKMLEEYKKEMLKKTQEKNNEIGQLNQNNFSTTNGNTIKIEPQKANNSTTKSQYVKQKIYATLNLKKAKKEKYISQIDNIVKKQNKEKLEIILKNISKIKAKYNWKNKDILDYLEATIYIELNK